MKKSLGLNSKFFLNSTKLEPLILEYDLSLGDPGNNITLYLGSRTSNIAVDWGDGQTEIFTTSGEKTHTYATTGVYQVKITGGLTFLGSNNDAYGYIPNLQKKLTKCISFGNVPLTSLNRAFINSSIIQVPTTLPSTVTNLSRVFWGTPFNQDISGWDTRNVTLMHYMFYNTTEFNQPIGNWNVENVTDMAAMFALSKFNQPIGNWNVSRVSIMHSVFSTSPFNQDISNWTPINATQMQGMFKDNSAFNQDISSWNVSKVIFLNEMFNNATAFNQNLGAWQLNRIVNYPQMTNMLTNCGMSTENYSKTLIGWANYVSTNGAPYTRSLGAGGCKYNSTNYGGTPYSDAVSARALLTGSPSNWTISGDAIE